MIRSIFAAGLLIAALPAAVSAAMVVPVESSSMALSGGPVSYAPEWAGTAPPAKSIEFYSVASPTRDGTSPIGNPVAAAVPEPASWAMLIAGFAVTGVVLRRRATRHAAA